MFSTGAVPYLFSLSAVINVSTSSAVINVSAVLYITLKYDTSPNPEKLTSNMPKRLDLLAFLGTGNTFIMPSS